MTDPLAYLDEIDARAERYPEVEPPCLVYMPGEWIGDGSNDDDRASRAFDAGVAWARHRDRADLLALSRALRAVLDVVEDHERREAHNEAVPLNRISDLQPEPSAADYRQAIQAALAVNDEGGSDD